MDISNSTAFEMRLEALFFAGQGNGNGAITLRLTNISDRTIEVARLSFNMMFYLDLKAKIEGARLVGRFGNSHDLVPDGDCVLAPGEVWEIGLNDLFLSPKHRGDGPSSAVVVDMSGGLRHVSVTDMQLAEGEDSGELKPRAFAGEAEAAMIPWPRSVAVDGWRSDAPLMVAAEGTSAPDCASMDRIARLSRRLFPEFRVPFGLSQSGVPVSFERDSGLETEGYVLVFSADGIFLRFATGQGRDYGLITLAQLFHGAQNGFKFPQSGSISDAPRFARRGSHLDVSRHFWTGDQVCRFLDILAWHKMNVMQWHLTDDEGWRLAIDAYPKLTSVGGFRGPEQATPAQYTHADSSYGGFYSKPEVRAIVAHGQALHVEIVPEIDVPGHCTAVLAAYPELRDPGEAARSYHSIQGFPNNALNPAMDETYDFIETVLGEVAELFPSDIIHLGGDEVDMASWSKSPKVEALMNSQGFNSAMEVQAYFMRKVQKCVRSLGKRFAGWDEVSQGGGIDPEGTFLVAWQSRELVGELIEMGYDVVASPGQSYYLDMVQADGWDEPGASWAGVSRPQECYEYEPTDGLSEAAAERLMGVQTGIWCEQITTPQRFNYMVFPRLSAVAETGWSAKSAKDWSRFAAISGVMPRL